jgi:OOP family OmpA-OmpF porin
MLDDRPARGDSGAAGSAIDGTGSASAADAGAEAARQAELALQAKQAEAAAALAAAARRGHVDTPGSHVDIAEDEKLETLGGMLPMAIGMDERGLFDFDRYLLRDEVKATLDVLAQKLNEAVYDRLVIYGYADRLGTTEYNKSLSEKRAWAVAGYLMDRGVPPHKLKVEGRGEQDSVTAVDACEGLTRTEQIECYQRDRRVEITATVKQYSLQVQ